MVGIEDLKRLEGGLIASTRSEVLKKAATLRKKIAFGGRKIRPVEEDLAKIRGGVCWPGNAKHFESYLFGLLLGNLFRLFRFF